jgi:hypothetical protein
VTKEELAESIADHAMGPVVTARLQRFAVYLCDRAVGGGWSPSLNVMGLCPTLRWCWTGSRDDLARVGPHWMDPS